MTTDYFFGESLDALRSATGVIIPVFLPDKVDGIVARGLLRDTALALQREVADPSAICLSVDGPGPGVAAAEEIAEESGAQVARSETNRGKLSAARNGAARLLETKGLRYFAIVDQDGDHFPNELLNFVRMARHVEASAGADEVMVLGRRISRHRPMGYLRGELEELADRMLLDALRYDAAVSGNPLRLSFATALDEFPDFHSGYKLFTRTTAERVFLAEPDFAGTSEDCYYRHAVEAVIAVEAIKSGAILAVVNRSTLNEQPVSTFALLDRRRMVADKIAWPCKRLGAPPEFVDQWMRNHIPRLQLGTLAPEGKDELIEIYRLVAEAFGIRPDRRPPDGPLFV